MKRNAVIVFGRFQPPTIGHERLIRFLKLKAWEHRAVPIVFASPTWDVERNPIPFGQKVGFLRKLFRGVIVNVNERIRTPFDALATLSMMGYTTVLMVVGSDETENFWKIEKYIKPRGLKDGRNIILKKFGVVTVPGVRNEKREDITGMSATKLRRAALAGDYATFAKGIPSQDRRVVEQLYDSVRGVNE